MSTQREEPLAGDPTPDPAPQADSSRRFVRALRLLAGLSALVSLAALWSVEAKQLTHDLQLAAPLSARPGDRIALRALLFRDVDAAAGASLALAETRVRLLDPEGRELAAVSLQATELDTLDGTLQLPAVLPAGAFVLEARARFEETDLVCRRSFELDPHAAPITAHGREAGPLQHLSLGPVRSLDVAPRPLLPRVVGGACIPGEPCRVLVWVGQPAASLTARVDGGAELLGAPLPASESSAIVELRVLVRGPDAQLTLETRRAGVLVGERSLRLPVGLAEVALLAPDSIVERDALRVPFAPPPGRAFVTFDSFADDHWSGLSVVASATHERPYVVPPEYSAFGPFRLQARADRLSAEGAGARVFYLRAPGEDDRSVLQSLAQRAAAEPALEQEPTAAWARELPAFALAQPQQTAAYLLAGFEQLRMPVPAPVSGRPAQLSRLEHTRALFRFGVAGALVLSAFVMALSLARRGLAAADEAQSILDLARGDGEDQASAARPGELLGARLRVLLLALAVAAAFLAAALLIAAKPLWF